MSRTSSRLKKRRCSMEMLEGRVLLSTVTWNSVTGGLWSTPGNWSGGVVPTASSNVVITQPGNIQITLTGNASVASLSITGDKLSISTGTLAVAGAVSNSGAIVVNPGGQLNAGGAYSETAGATLTLPSGALGSGVGTNLLSNSGFESPAAAGSTTTSPGVWGTWGSSYVSTQYARGGVQSLVASGPNSGVEQTFSATPGVSYTASVYAMTPSTAKLTGPEGAFFNLLFYDAGGNQISPYGPPNSATLLTSTSPTGGPFAGSVGGQGWNFYTLTAVAPSNAAAVSVDLVTGAYTGNSGTAGGSVYWDDPEIGPTATTTAVVDAGSVSNSGSISIGAGDTVNVTGTFSQSGTGTLNVLLGSPPAGDEFGTLKSGGAATLAGTLSASLVNGYAPALSDGFNVVSYPSESGAFGSYQVPAGSTYPFAPTVSPTYVGISAVPVSPTVAVNVAGTIGTAPANFLGVNLAWWDDSLDTAQTTQMVQAAGLDAFRFPGGSSSDDFHFNVQANYSDPVAITISQFAQVIAADGGVGLVTMDYGSGSPQEAEAELAYLAGSPSDTTVISNGIEWSDTASKWQTVNWQTVGYWASRRAAKPLAVDDGLNFMRINHAAPFSQIKYWEVGNEEYGSWEVDHHGTNLPNGTSTGAQHDPATYAQFAETFAAFVAADQVNLPAIQIGIDSQDPTGAADNNWTRNVLADGVSDGFVPGFISDHSYMQAPGSESDSFLLNDTVSDSTSLLDWSTRDADYRSLLQQTLGGSAASVQVLATEFNSVYSNPGKQTTSLVNGLFIADSIGSLLTSGYGGGFVWDLRNGWDTSENNSSTLYGWREGGDYGLLGDPNTSLPPSTGPYVPYPSYFAEQLASKIVQTGGEVVSAVSSYGEMSTYAVLEPNGHLELLVINKNPDAAVTEQFSLAGFSPSGSMQVWQYGEAQDDAQSQSTAGASALANFAAAVNLSGGGFSYTLPAYSMTVLDLTPASKVSSFTVNDGSAQRSMVTSLTVAFNEAVTLASGAITLGERNPAGGAETPETFTLTNPSGDQKTYVLTFTDPSYIGASLPDGVYDLTVHAALVANAAGGGMAGGDQTYSFCRLYGDYFGTGSVGFNDLVLLAQDFGATSGGANYLPFMDVDGDGTIGFAELVKLAQNFGDTQTVAAAATPAQAAPLAASCVAAGPVVSPFSYTAPVIASDAETTSDPLASPAVVLETPSLRLGISG